MPPRVMKATGKNGPEAAFVDQIPKYKPAHKIGNPTTRKIVAKNNQKNLFFVSKMKKIFKVFLSVVISFPFDPKVIITPVEINKVNPSFGENRGFR
jgi:hypothetical protein